MKAIVNVPICPLLDRPGPVGGDYPTVVDEALYGMVVELLESPAPGWRRVRTHYRYEGVVREADLIPGDAEAAAWAALPKLTVWHKNFCDVLTAPKVQGYPLVTLPRGAVVSPTGEAEKGWRPVRLAAGPAGFVPDGSLGPYYTAPSAEEEGALRRRLTETALLYRRTPYRWGGKSPMGIDCSGLVSMAYLLNGIVIYRDAGIKEGFPIRPIDPKDAKPGDLLFFPGHVAMYLGEGRYVHSTGRAGDDGVAINSLDPAAPDFRRDLLEKLSGAGSYF